MFFTWLMSRVFTTSAGVLNIALTTPAPPEAAKCSSGPSGKISDMRSQVLNWS